MEEPQEHHEPFDFQWSNHAFRDGEAENKRVLAQFEKDFYDIVEKSGARFDDEKNLMKGLDLAVAFIKNYELDKAEKLYEELLPAARERGLPAIAKALQDVATLRFKQNRQAESALLLEELRDMMPPHPTIFHNLGTTYNSLRRHSEALTCFQLAIKLKEMEDSEYKMDYSDHWDLGLAYKNLGRKEEARECMEQAFKLCPGDDIVMLAKVHDSLGSTYLELAEFEKAQEQYASALALFREALGDSSPLTGTAAEMLAKAYMKDKDCPKSLENAKEALMIALEVQAGKDAIHPTPLFEIINDILDAHMGTQTCKSLIQYHGTVEKAWEQLKAKGLANDANAGLVRHKMALVYLFSGGEHVSTAFSMLIEARALIATGREGETDVSELLDMVDQHIAAVVSLSAPNEQDS